MRYSDRFPIDYPKEYTQVTGGKLEGVGKYEVF